MKVIATLSPVASDRAWQRADDNVSVAGVPFVESGNGTVRLALSSARSNRPVRRGLRIGTSEQLARVFEVLDPERLRERSGHLESDHRLGMFNTMVTAPIVGLIISVLISMTGAPHSAYRWMIGDVGDAPGVRFFAGLICAIAFSAPITFAIWGAWRRETDRHEAVVLRQVADEIDFNRKREQLGGIVTENTALRGAAVRGVVTTSQAVAEELRSTLKLGIVGYTSMTDKNVQIIEPGETPQAGTLVIDEADIRIVALVACDIGTHWAARQFGRT